MDPRTAAHALTQIAALLEVRPGTNQFKARAYRTAARAILSLDTDDIAPLYRDGRLAAVAGIGPSTLGVLGELVDAGESRYLEHLRENTPAGLLEMLRIPGLGTAKIQQIHEALGLETVPELEQAARDGRLAKLPRFGLKTAEKILQGIAFFHETSAFVLYPRAATEAQLLVAAVRRHPDVTRADLAGSVRRRLEIVDGIDLAAGCSASPEEVAASFARAPSVAEAKGVGTATVRIRFVDGTRLHLHCVRDEAYALGLWRATGSAEHVAEVAALAHARGFTLTDDALVDPAGATVPLPDERAIYGALGLAFVEPELREALGEVEAARLNALPSLIELADIRGVLHCHTRYSDGTATVAEMAAAAKARGWSYLGISDHSQSAGYANGLTRDDLLRQHDEIDQVNASDVGVRVLKGIEADILATGEVDYEPDMADRFDFIIGSIHSRFAMNETQMTERVLKALDDPNLSILGHPTGRLLLAREPYRMDLEAVIEKASEGNVAVELNADPRRLDLDWRGCRRAKELGVPIEIGPDAHSIRSLDNVQFGIGLARKAWLEPGDVLNTRSADAIVAFARPGGSGRAASLGTAREGGHGK